MPDSSPPQRASTLRLFLLIALPLLAFAGIEALSSTRAPHDARQSVVQASSPSAPVRAAPVLGLPAAADDAGRAPSCVFDVGQRLAYDLSLITATTTDAAQLGLPASSGGAARRPTLTTSTSATLELEVLALEKAGAVVLARYRELRSEHVRHVDVLRAPFLARIAQHCEVTGFARLERTPVAYARIQQALLHELSWYWPSSGRAEREAEDGTGQLVAVYAEADHAGGKLVQRRIEYYAQYWDDERARSPELEPEPEQAMTHVRVGAGPWFDTLVGHVVLSGPSQRIDTRVHAATRDPEPSALEQASRAQGDYVWENLLPTRYQVRTPRAVTPLDRAARNRLRHMTPQQIVDAYLARVQAGKGIAEQWADLQHYLEVRPEMTGELIEMLMKGTIPDEAAPAVYIALGRARTPQARQALLDILHDGAAPALERTRAMFNLVDRDDVDVTLAQTLAEYSPMTVSGDSLDERIVGREATLALGMMAGRQDDPEVDRVARTAIEQLLSTARTARSMRPALGAIANVGDPTLLALAEPAATSRDRATREASTVVIRRLRPSDATPFVQRVLATEGDPGVRRALYGHMQGQLADRADGYGDEVIDLAIRDLKSGVGPVTRTAIVNVLGRAVDTHPRARAALIEQLAIEQETGSGVYDAIIRHLKPEDIREALAYAR